ncbi:ABC transporter permease [candidate division KSB1 bacterium]
MKSKPPKIARWLLCRLRNKTDHESLIGDYNEIYQIYLNELGAVKANVWYWKQLFKSLPSLFSNSIYWSLTMFRNYLKTAIRSLSRQKVYSVMNIFSLALGITVFLLTTQIFNFCHSFDKFHKDADRIYGVVEVLPEGHNAILPAPMIPAMTRDYPEITDAAYLYDSERKIVKYDNQMFYESNILYVSPNFLLFFSFDMLEGNPNESLKEPNSIVLTEKTAKKYFGDKNPVGEILTLNNTQNFIVSGIVKDVPKNSSIQFDFLVSAENINKQLLQAWDAEMFTCFLKFPVNHGIAALEAKFPDFIDKYLNFDPKKTPERLYLYPLEKFHLKSLHIKSFLFIDSFEQLYFGLVIGVLFLLVVCFNYMSLSTSRYMNRIKEVGLRKVVGADSRMLKFQFIGESVLIAFFAMIAALLFYQILEPILNALWGDVYDLSLNADFTPVFNLVIIAVAVGLITGIYPAFFLSGFRPSSILSGRLYSGKKGAFLRKFLVVSQFTATGIFIIFSLSLENQIDHLYKINLGYNQDNIFVLPLNNIENYSVAALMEELKRHPEIKNVSGSWILPVNWHNEQQIFPEGTDETSRYLADVYAVDYNFIETLEMRMQEGRSFSELYTDKADGEHAAYIVNKSAANVLNWEDPVGKQLIVNGRKGTIVGILQDFNFRRLFYDTKPAVFYIPPGSPNYILVKFYSSESEAAVLSYIQSGWKKVIPTMPMETFKLKDRFDDMLRDSERVGIMFWWLGIITVLIACMGLLGLVSYNIQRRTKEIGIRKVMGASVSGISGMFLKRFLRMIIVANLISIPIGYVSAKYLLDFAFAYNPEFDIKIYIITLIITLTLSVVAVITRIIRAAYSNPVDTLRYE